MDRRSRILLEVFLCLAVISLSLTFYRYIILNDFNFYVDEEAFQEALLEE